MRDLKADLEICEKATPGPWELTVKGNSVKSYAIDGICHGMKIHGKDAFFVAEAREGWPEAIRRAIKAEAQAAAMREALEHIAIGQCVFKQMAKFQMGFGFSEQAFTEQYGFCDCATCVTSKALAALDGIPIPPEGSDV